MRREREEDGHQSHAGEQLADHLQTKRHRPFSEENRSPELHQGGLVDLTGGLPGKVEEQCNTAIRRGSSGIDASKSDPRKFSTRRQWRSGIGVRHVGVNHFDPQPYIDAENKKHYKSTDSSSSGDRW